MRIENFPKLKRCDHSPKRDEFIDVSWDPPYFSLDSPFKVTYSEKTGANIYPTLAALILTCSCLDFRSVANLKDKYFFNNRIYKRERTPAYLLMIWCFGWGFGCSTAAIFAAFCWFQFMFWQQVPYQQRVSYMFSENYTSFLPSSQ